MMSINATTTQALETIEMMMTQEEGRYLRTNWLNEESTTVTADDRAQTATWYLQLADCLDLQSHETLEISMSILDRYARSCSRKGVLTLEKYQIASLSCLYTAIKCHEPEAMTPELASQLSQGRYSPGQIEKSEMEVLLATNWAINPPTVVAYVRELLSLLPSALSEPNRAQLMKVVQRQIDESFRDASFLDLDCADIAYIVLANAMQVVLAPKCKASLVDRVRGILARTLMVRVEDMDRYERKLVRVSCKRNSTARQRSPSPRSVVRF